MECFVRETVIAVTTICFLAIPADAQEILSAEALVALAAPARNFNPKDQFDLPPNVPSVEGKGFNITIKPLSSPKGCSGFAGWEYDGQKQQFTAFAGHRYAPEKLKFGPKIEVPKRHEWDSITLHYTGIACEQAPPRTYRAANAFGTEMDVSVVRDRVVAIGFVTSDLYDDLKAWDRDPYYKVTATGDDARKLTTSIQIRISGRLGVWPDGRTLICADETGNAPTRDFPVDWAQETCIFNGHIEKIEYLDGNGAVLAVVNAKPAKRR
jgi:hypothetical protein